MVSARPGGSDLTPELLLRAYAAGIFPMADGRDDGDIHWIQPRHRGILPLVGFHVPRRLGRTLRRGIFQIRCDTAFAEVVRRCAAATPARRDTWINREIEAAVVRLHDLGHAHSVECWSETRLVGGLYGIALGGAFFGESMFSNATDASKAALVHLVARLRLGGYRLLDAQFMTEHLRQFGALEIPADAYRERLQNAVSRQCRFPGDASPQAVAAEMEAVFAGK